MPLLIWQYFNSKAKQSTTDKSSAYNKYSAATYYLNQLGYSRSLAGPQQFALQIDQQFKTDLSSFNAVYQKVKYSPVPLTEEEKQIVDAFYRPFIKQVKQQIPLKTRFSRFLNIYNTIHFFSKSKIN